MTLHRSKICLTKSHYGAKLAINAYLNNLAVKFEPVDNRRINA